MKLYSSVRASMKLIFPLMLAATLAFGQGPRDDARSSNGAALSKHLPERNSALSSSPGVLAHVEPQFIGAYRPDGVFAKGSYRKVMSSGPYAGKQLRPIEVPPWIDLHPIESVVENYAPPGHARENLRGHSGLGSFRDDLITFLYGRERVLLAPTHVTTDSMQRVIVADPDGPSVHVLDGKHSFRIAGGSGYRLRYPNGVAVDSRDNIYVADSAQGIVLVYDSQGHFRRVIGAYEGESLLQNPTGIAIDRQNGRLYVLDSPSNELVVFDLSGRVLNRIGGRRHQPNGLTFDYPSEIAVGRGTVVVLDTYGSRIQVLDLQGNLQKSFRIRGVTDGPVRGEIGLALDSAGNIYVSEIGPAGLRVYTPSGELISSSEELGEIRMIRAHSGMWIDSSDRIYLSDSNKSCVQVFQATSRQQP